MKYNRLCQEERMQKNRCGISERTIDKATAPVVLCHLRHNTTGEIAHT
jgi:hypothetical protein